MKQLTQASFLLLGLMVAFAGCTGANDALDNAQNTGGDLLEGAKGMADIDFGDFDAKGMTKKFTGITDGFKNVTADNVDGLSTKISDLSGSVDNMGIGKLTGPAKSYVGGAITKFMDAIKGAMGGIKDEGILSKLKPVVATLMEKLNVFK